MLKVVKRGPSSDWSSLPAELLDIILSTLRYTSDYIRFAAVCKHWRYVVLMNPERIADLPPLLLVGDKKPDPLNFYNLQPFKVYDVKEDRLYNHPLQVPRFPWRPAVDDYYGSSYGWLVLVRGKYRSVVLFNPFSQKIITTPSPSSGFLCKVILSCNPIMYPNDYILGAICWTHELGYCVAFKKACQKPWKFVQRLPRLEKLPWVFDIIFHQGLLYVLGAQNQLMKIDCWSDYGDDNDKWVPIIEFVPVLINQGIKGTYKFVEVYNHTNLFLVERINPSEIPTVDSFKFYKLNKKKEEELEWVEICKSRKSVGSVFLVDEDDHYRKSAISVPNFSDQDSEDYIDLAYIKGPQSLTDEETDEEDTRGLFWINKDGTSSRVQTFKVDRNFVVPLVWITPTLMPI